MRAITLFINDVPICGIVGPDDAQGEMFISVNDCQRIYQKYARQAADGPMSAISMQWKINGIEVDAPKAWFVTIKLC